MTDSLPERADGTDGWRRLSPLSPLVRGGLVLVAIIGYWLAQWASSLMGALGGPWGDPPGTPESGEEPPFIVALMLHPLTGLAVFVAVIAVVVGVGWLSWRFSRYRVTPSQVEFRKGLVFREHRQVPIDRIQAVEIARPLLAQVLRLAEVVVQSAGGSGSQLRIAFLPVAQAQELRLHIQALAARGSAAAGATGPAPSPADLPPLPADDPTGWPAPGVLPGDLLGLGSAEGREVVKVPNTRLMAATMLHTSLFALLGVLALGAASSWVSGGRWSALQGFLVAVPALGPLVLGIGAARVRELLKHGNFALYDVGGSVKIVHGLTDHRTRSVPIHRVQAMELLQPLWWRPFGWWRLRLNVAGTATESGEMVPETIVLPVGPMSDALAVLLLLDPSLERAALEEAALGNRPADGWTTTSERARWLDPWSWRRNGYAVSPRTVYIRRGRWTRSVVVVPHARIQSMTMRQGPLEHHLDVADVHLVSIPGPVSPVVTHLSTAAAHEFFEAERIRAALARQSTPTDSHEKGLEQ